jgi:uncharacterized protein YbcI
MHEGRRSERRVDDAPHVGGGTRARISNALVGLHTRHYGKGPKAAKTWLVDDTVVCILRDPFTRVELTLIKEGQKDAVFTMRDRFQSAMRDEFTGVVEEATGRQVIAYMSQINVDPDLSVELFVLQPSASSDGGPNTAENAGS